MASTVQSRFAVLSLDAEDATIPKKTKTAKKLPDSKSNAAKNNVGLKNKNGSKMQAQNKSKGKPKQTTKKKEKKKKEALVQPHQWEEWQQKDSQMVQGNFEEDLTEAILLSKLNYEENKPLYDAMSKEMEEKKVVRKNKKGLKVISLAEFNSSGNNREESPPEVENGMEEDDSLEFFDRFQEDVKVEITKERESVKKKKKERVFNQEDLTVAQLTDALEKRNRHIVALKQEWTMVREKLNHVRSRNKILSDIMASGDMKEKTDILMEVNRLQTVKDELIKEIETLRVQIKEERSKNNPLCVSDQALKEKSETVDNQEGLK